MLGAFKRTNFDVAWSVLLPEKLLFIKQWQEHLRVPEVSDDGNWPVTHPLTTCSQEIYVSKWETSQGANAAGSMHAWERSMPGVVRTNISHCVTQQQASWAASQGSVLSRTFSFTASLTPEDCWASLFTPTHTDTMAGAAKELWAQTPSPMESGIRKKGRWSGPC